MAKLTPKQAAFCREYRVDKNATQAAIRAGYSRKTAKDIGSENLAKPDIQAEINRLISEDAEETGINARSVLTRLNSVANRCMQAEPVLDKLGRPTGEYQFNASGANKSLELLGKYFQMFVDRVENVDLNSLNDFATQFVQIALRHVSDPEERRAILADLEAMGAGDA